MAISLSLSLSLSIQYGSDFWGCINNGTWSWCASDVSSAWNCGRFPAPMIPQIILAGRNFNNCLIPAGWPTNKRFITKRSSSFYGRKNHFCKFFSLRWFWKTIFAVMLSYAEKFLEWTIWAIHLRWGFVRAHVFHSLAEKNCEEEKRGDWKNVFGGNGTGW